MDLATEKAKLLQRDAEWAALASEGKEVESLLSYWTDDAVVLPPGMAPVKGKAALRDYVLGSLEIPGFNITWSSHDVVLSPDGNLGYMFSDNTLSMNDPDGTPMKLPGRAVTVWRRDADGEWRCVLDIWNSGPTA